MGSRRFPVGFGPGSAARDPTVAREIGRRAPSLKYALRSMNGDQYALRSMNGDNGCQICGGSGWIEIRTRGMCGIDCDFLEVERTPCEICNPRALRQVESSSAD